MPASDAKTEQLMYALGHRNASIDAADGCCNTKTQQYLLDAIQRVNNLQDELEEAESRLPISGDSDPTTSTVGKTVGQIYTNTTTGKQFILKSIADDPAVYTWQALGDPEAFVFTLADSSTVTKNILVA